MVRWINANCVAVALTDTRDDRRGGNRVAGCGGGGNALYLITAAGRRLGDQDLFKALEEFRGLPVAEQRPKLPSDPETGECRTLAPPRGGLILKFFERYLDRDARGALSHVTHDWSPGRWDHITKIYAEPQHDHLWLTEAEWKSLLPPEPRKGVAYPMPERIAHRIFSGYIVCIATGAGPAYWDRDAMNPRRLTITVEEAGPSGFDLRLDGHLRVAQKMSIFREHDREGRRVYFDCEFGIDARLLGRAAYDVRKKAFTRFDLVGVGEAWGEDSITTPGFRPGPHGWTFELVSGDRPLDRVPPSDHRLKLHE
jgi:hypothetical protein